MKLLKGKKIADKILKDLKQRIKISQAELGLAVILAGENQASKTYVRLKEKAAKKVGINFYLFKFSEKSKEREIIKKIKELNRDKKVSGIIVQLPLPKKISAQGGSASGWHTQKIINAIDPQKDADGFSAKSGGKIAPVFPKAIIKVLEAVPKAKLSEILKLSFRKKAVIIANSKIFGEMMKIALKNKKIKSDYVIIKNKTLPYYSIREKVKNAGIVITAIGKPEIIKGKIIKKGAIIIDGGITKKRKKVLGDVDYESVKKIAGYLSPVPGGVGPVTVACLLENVCLLAKKSR